MNTVTRVFGLEDLGRAQGFYGRQAGRLTRLIGLTEFRVERVQRVRGLWVSVRGLRV